MYEVQLIGCFLSSFIFFISQQTKRGLSKRKQQKRLIGQQNAKYKQKIINQFYEDDKLYHQQ